MAQKKWTQGQKNAIYAQNGSLLVSAAAGSGKTAVLVERVIARITDPDNPVDADRLLVVTFTRAAAAEMKERISLKLDELIAENPLDSALRRQQLLLSKANISTIHSFCSELVRESFFALDISPDFRLAEESELAILKAEAINNVLENLYENEGEAFSLFADYFSTAKSDYLLQQVVLKLYEFLCAHPFPESWLQKKEQMYSSECPITETQWGRVTVDYAQDAARFCLALAENSLALFEERPELGDALRSLLQLDLKFTQGLCETVASSQWDEMRGYLSSFDFSARFQSARGYKDDAIKLKIQSSRDLLKKKIKSLCSLFTQSEQQCRDDIRELAPLVHELFSAVRLFSREYEKLKREKNIADFNDLEHWALSLLVTETPDGAEFTPQAQAAAQRFAEVMVDEYQDANEIQDLIFRALSGDGKRLFVVGDVKQSIYGFRQAMPEIFLRRKDAYALYDPALDNYPAKIILDKNFRSRRGVTDAVNFVFRRLMSKEVGGMEYTREEELAAGAQYEADASPDMAFHLLDSGAQDEDCADILEARHIARMIHKNMESYQVTENGVRRAAKYSDFCILLRSASTHAAAYVKELTAQGIPASSQSSDGFLCAREVAVMVSFLRLIDNPLQDIPLLNVMMSPVYGFTPDDLAQMRIAKPKGRLYFALKSYAQEGSLPARQLLLDLDDCRALAATAPADLLVHFIYTRTGYPALVRSRRSGALGLSNLRLLQEYAKNYEQSGGGGLSGFVRYIDRLEEQGCDLKTNAAALSQSESVRVMSIHHSKGLEFPFCFLAATARSFNSDKTDEVLLHAELGIGIRRKDTQRMCRYSTMPRGAVSLELERDGKSEELRVLYVAMTRAREKLIVLSTQTNPRRYLETMASRLTGESAVLPYIVRGASCISNWITQCALMHPDGACLRELAGMPRAIECEPCLPWEISIIEGETPAAVQEPAKAGQAEKKEPAQPLDITPVVRRIVSEYPYQTLGAIPVKVSASELSHEESRGEYAFSTRPAFLQKEKMTGAQRGTALHAFMQFADFTAYLTSPQEELARLVEKGFITNEQRQAIPLKEISACLQSGIMRRFLCAGKQYREFRFTVKIKAGLADKELKPPYCDEAIILQGAVDCAFEEAGGIVIVDYKTDRVKNLEELRSRYHTQLELYRCAMEQCTGLPVRECVLYSFHLNGFIGV